MLRSQNDEDEKEELKSLQEKEDLLWDKFYETLISEYVSTLF